MEKTTNSGWRKLPEGPPILFSGHHDASRSQLFRVKKLADQALGLARSSIAVLGSLISFYHEPLKGRILVWPSNEALCDATGYSERAIRIALRDLIDKGLVAAKDSPNGKRFCQRDKRSGQIVDAYGFDLSGLIEREKEFKEVVLNQNAERDLRKREWDDLTVCRRSVDQVIRTFGEWHPDFDIRELVAKFDRLLAQTPRRAKDRAAGPLLGAWRGLKEEAEALFHTANDGNNCRHKEDNNEAFDQSCNNGQEGLGRGEISLGDVVAACPAAIGYADKVRTETELVLEAGRLRGAFGTHRSAWEEACADLGRVRAAVTFFMVLQLYDDDQNGRRQIKNFGGLFRATARRVAAGELDLVAEIAQMKRRRHH
jgi:replication initiation protein RepC